ncbi:alkaline phosphatase [Thermospira aquatica]|uniref:Alkaline phosphatase n=1 Tax=Thermospira aquatica TaxID=2828656 RepID=A0AAX3BAZ2_9SPIR|nr:alkaline phosphatase [Thermospira aquatica]URA09463.1 alkaline phosphatase [Thermospira aquatica]
MRKICVLWFMTMVVLGHAQGANKTGSSQVSMKPKNIILLIGDGFGVSHLSSRLLIEKNIWKHFPRLALMTTFAENNLVTDSAAGGTALATGFKTKNGFIAVSPTGESLPTLMEYAKKKGKATGLVVTCTVTHATPAVFYAHESSRANENAIALWVTNETIDLMIGGGLSYFGYRFTNEAMVTHYNQWAGEGTNFVSLANWMTYRGWKVVSNVSDLSQVKGTTKVLGLLAYGHLPYVAQGRTNSLGELTAKALELLSREKNGFVLMVEGSQIDWASHDNNVTNLIPEMEDFEQAVEVALAFAEKDKNTLVVVTADHETGGVSLPGGIKGKFVRLNFSSKDHTAAMVPVLTYGPGMEEFSGILDNTEVGQKLIQFVK